MKTLLIAIMSASLLSACGGGADTASAKGPARPTNKAARQVKVSVAEEKSIDQVANVTGTLAAEQEIVLGMKAAGRLMEVNVDLGSTVSKGDVIARLDPTDFDLRVRQSQAALEQALVRLGLPPDSKATTTDPESTALVKQAKARLEQARAIRDRTTLLDEKGLIAKSDVDSVIAGYAVAEASYQDSLDEARNRQGVLVQRRSELEIARQQLMDAVLTSPIDGMIRFRQSSSGQYVAVGAPIVTVVQMNPLRLRAAVPERQAKDVRVGQSVRVSVDGVPGTHPGRVERISPAVDETNRTLLIEASVQNPNNVLRPGAFAKSDIILSTGQKSLIVPVAALGAFAGIERVFIVKDGKASEKRVKTGRRLDAGVEILNGISVGDTIVINPGDLNDGDAVTASSST